MGEGDKRPHHRWRQCAREVSQPVENAARRRAHPWMSGLRQQGKNVGCASAPHKGAEAHRGDDGQRGVEVHDRRQPDSRARHGDKAGCRTLIDPVREPRANHFARQHGDERHRRQPARMLQVNAFAFDQVARQPAIDAPQVGQEGDVKDADDPEVRADEQLAPRGTPLILRRLRGARFRLQADTTQTDAHENQYRHGKHRHHEEGALPAEGVQQPEGERKTNRRAHRRAEQPQHGGARLQMLREVVTHNGEGQREQRPLRHPQQNAQHDHQRIVVGKAHRHHQHAPDRHHPGQQAQRRDFIPQPAEKD